MQRVGRSWGHSLGPAHGNGDHDAVRLLEWRRVSEPEKMGEEEAPGVSNLQKRMEGCEDYLEFPES